MSTMGPFGSSVEKHQIIVGFDQRWIIERITPEVGTLAASLSNLAHNGTNVPSLQIWWFLKIGTPKIDGFITLKTLMLDDLEVPLF